MQSYAPRDDIAWPEQAGPTGQPAPAVPRIRQLSRRELLTGTSAMCLVAVAGGAGLTMVIRDGWVLRPEDI